MFSNEASKQAIMAVPLFELNTSLLPTSMCPWPLAFDPMQIESDPGAGSLGNNLDCSASASPLQTFARASFVYGEEPRSMREDQLPMPIPNVLASPPFKYQCIDQSFDVDDGYNVQDHIHHLPDCFFEIGSGTDVDVLMRTIQHGVKAIFNKQRCLQTCEIGMPAYTTEPSVDRSARSSSNIRRKYPCKLQSCGKVFNQKTHLEIHMRSHTGHKPYFCKEATCGKRFTQLGNLRTHERRHTGERPYSCEQCGRRFAQRGNVQAHRVVHEQIKPYCCKLDKCAKRFTQLGNLKSHQNKFHPDTLRTLADKFSLMQHTESMSETEQELWEYFSNLYKNSNKGIKGRGKDRRNKCSERQKGNVQQEVSVGNSPNRSSL